MKYILSIVFVLGFATLAFGQDKTAILLSENALLKAEIAQLKKRIAELEKQKIPNQQPTSKPTIRVPKTDAISPTPIVVRKQPESFDKFASGFEGVKWGEDLSKRIDMKRVQTPWDGGDWAAYQKKVDERYRIGGVKITTWYCQWEGKPKATGFKMMRGQLNSEFKLKVADELSTMFGSVASRNPFLDMRIWLGPNSSIDGETVRIKLWQDDGMSYIFAVDLTND